MDEIIDHMGKKRSRAEAIESVVFAVAESMSHHQLARWYTDTLSDDELIDWLPDMEDEDEDEEAENESA